MRGARTNPDDPRDDGEARVANEVATPPDDDAAWWMPRAMDLAGSDAAFHHRPIATDDADAGMQPALKPSPIVSRGRTPTNGRAGATGRARIHVPKTIGARAAGVVAAAMASWRFIIFQSAIVVVWIALNLVAILHHCDPYSFILLNLLFSTQAAFAAPIIIMSQNRQAAKDRQRDDHEAVTVDMTADIVRLTHTNTEEIGRLAREQAEILAAQDRVLARQSEILTLLRGHMAQGEQR